MPRKMLQEFFRLESAGGILLMLAAVLAILMENSPLSPLYELLLGTPLKIQLGSLYLDKPLLLWINDGLMAVFFLLVGLEIKREVLEGQLSSREQVALPAVAALGGLAVPALFYVMLNQGNPEALRGWAIPAATDIAFALGVISLLGRRAPQSLKVTLVALAIIDDLAAIVIIAVFYTASLNLISLGLACLGLVCLVILNRRGVLSIAPYMLAGAFIWVCVLKSGVHATLAGVVVALAVPIRDRRETAPAGVMEGDDRPRRGTSPLRRLEHGLHPWVAYGILPVFAFANAGVPLGELSPGVLFDPMTLGIAGGLFAGKQAGVMLFTMLAVLLGICRLPEDAGWGRYYGMALLTGIGFTMSLFIGSLAFDTPDKLNVVRVGVLAGSLLSGLAGYAVLRLAGRDDK